MQFYNGIIAPLIIVPLRYYFSTYTKDSNLIWDPDEKKRTLDIGESFDFNKVSVQEKPRVVVTRGAYSVAGVGLSNNLAEQVSFSSTGGKKDSTHMVMYQGTATVTIEARNKGACELLADMVSHFIIWTRPVLCDSQGWKEFGMPLSVSDAAMIQDEDPNVPKFQINMSLPWQKEEHWRHRNDGVILKKILSEVKPVF